MASYPQIKIRHSPLTTYPGTAPTSFVGAQTAPGQRGTLPSFTDGNAYWFSSTGSDSGLGISGSPWRNLSKIFGFSSTWADSSGNGYTLTPSGTTNIITYPCAPKPPKGASAVAQYKGGLTGPAGLVNAIKGKTQYTFETWLFIPAGNTAPNQTIFTITGGGTTTFRWDSTGGFTFTSNGGGSINTPGSQDYYENRWYYVALVVNANVAGGTQIWVGDSPENASVVASGTVTVGIQAGASAISFGAADMCFARMAFSTAIRTSFPTLSGTANLTGLWRFSTPCLMESNPRPYVVFVDSGTWNEQVYCPWTYDMTVPFDFYAVDGAAPVIELGRGTAPNSYGPNYLGMLLASTPNYYINQTTGNDATGARNNSALPFKTIQAALSNGSVTNGDIFEIRDSSLYKETLTFPAGKQDLVLRAQLGKNPIVAPARPNNVQASLPNTAGTYSFKNITFEGYSYSSNCSLFYGSAGLVSVAMDGCAVRNFTRLANQAWGSINVTLASTNNAFASIAELSAGGSYLNCYFHNQAPLGTYVNTYAPLTTASFKLCTFDNTLLDFGVYYEINLFDQCLFINCVVQTNRDGRIDKSSAMTNCTLQQSRALIGGQCLIENCQQFSDSLNLASGFGIPASTSPSATGVLQVQNCSAIRNQINFNFDVKNKLAFSHLTSVAGTTGGYSWVFANPGIAAAPTALVSSGDVSAIVGTPSVAFTAEENALITSQTLGAENIALQAQDGGIFNAGDGLTDAGMDYISWDLPLNTLVNGLIFKGPINGEAALGSNYGATIEAAFCTFTGLGTYAMRGSDLGGAQNCLFQSNGHAFKSNAANAYVSGSIGNTCGGAFILNIGQGLVADHDTAFLCQYGIFEVPSSTAGQITNSIFSGSALYDYSGPNILSYCCAPNLDPSQAGSLDANSLSVDPLFFAPLSSDLRLQSPAIGNYYTSPCIGADNAGGNMGALAYTYGPATTTWTLLDFGAQDAFGNYYRNPDKVVRKELPIKLAEGDRENGAIFSVAATFKREYEMTWEQNSNDMPQDQVVEMLNMFTSFTNALQIDFGLGLGWQDGYFARQNGFEWTDMTGFYSDSAQPTPVRSITIREA